MQKVIANSTKVRWSPIRASYVARDKSAQFLPIENLFNGYRKQFAYAQIQTENLFVDAHTQTESFHRQNENVFSAQTQTYTSTLDCDVHVNSAKIRGGNRLKVRSIWTFQKSIRRVEYNEKLLKKISRQ